MWRTLLLIAGMGLFTFLLFHLGPSQIFFLVLGMGWRFLGVCLIFSVYQWFRAGALFQCLSQNTQFTRLQIFWVRVSGEAANFLTSTGPFLAEPTKAWLLTRRGLTGEEAFASVLTEYLIYLFISAALSIVGLRYLIENVPVNGTIYTAAVIVIYVAVIFLLVSAMAVWFRIHLIGAIIERFAVLPLIRNRFQVNVSAVHRMEDLLLLVLRDQPRRFFGVVLIDLTAHLILIAEIMWILQALDTTALFYYAFLIETSTKIVSIAFFFVPMQMGATEGANVLVFQALGLSAAGGFTLSFVRRLRSLFVSGIGVGALWFLSRRKSPDPD
ncbi:MAG: flippase-like domain-containing protein [Acidobacteria bacterium]|nr:flippase-like domain-containing protein [Acidobacteriota bacterium]